MHSLDFFEMSDCAYETQTLKAAAETLRHCSDHLKNLSLEFIEDVPIEFAETISKLTSLKQLSLLCCGMRLSVGKAIMEALQNCSQFDDLFIADSELTDCMTDFLKVDNHPSFCNLRRLYLTGSNLSRDDVVNLGKALNSAKLPKISNLSLSDNDLTNCISLLFGSSRIISLQTLQLESTSLSNSDMTNFSVVIENKRLPELKTLNLESNNLGSMENETKALLLSCVGQYTETQFDLNLRENDLSDVFQDEATTHCFKTKIKLTFN